MRVFRLSRFFKLYILDNHPFFLFDFLKLPKRGLTNELALFLPIIKCSQVLTNKKTYYNNILFSPRILFTTIYITPHSKDIRSNVI